MEIFKYRPRMKPLALLKHKQQLMSLWKKLCKYGERCHRAALKLAEEANKEMTHKVCTKFLSSVKDITARIL
jgi:hypothetical protein